MTPGLTVITRAGGAPVLPYVVAQLDPYRMRIAHAKDLAEARQIETEWQQRDYSFNPGDLRALKCVR